MLINAEKIKNQDFRHDIENFVLQFDTVFNLDNFVVTGFNAVDSPVYKKFGDNLHLHDMAVDLVNSRAMSSVDYSSMFTFFDWFSSFKYDIAICLEGSRHLHIQYGSGKKYVEIKNKNNGLPVFVNPSVSYLSAVRNYYGLSNSKPVSLYKTIFILCFPFTFILFFFLRKC